MAALDERNSYRNEKILSGISDEGEVYVCTTRETKLVLLSDLECRYYAPSFASTSATLDPIITWEDGLDADKDIAIISQHKFVPLVICCTRLC